MSYDINFFKQQLKYSVDYYKKNNEGLNSSYLDYCQANGGLTKVFQEFENLFEGNALTGDNEKGNLLSTDRFLSQGNQAFFETPEGKVIYVDFNNLDSTNGVLEDDAAMNKLKELTGNTGTYDNVNFGFNNVKFTNLVLAGTKDGVANTLLDTPTAVVQEIDLSNAESLKVLQNYFKELISDQPKATVKDLFGNPENFIGPNAVTGADEIKGATSRYIDDNTMIVYQQGTGGTATKDANGKYTITGGKAYIVKNENGKLTVSSLQDQAVANQYGKYLAQAGQVIDFKGAVSWSMERNTSGQYTFKGASTSGGNISVPTGTGTVTPGTATISAAGDPHFYSNGQHVFDFQGAGGGAEGTYSMLKDKDIEWNSSFVNGYNVADGSTVMGAQELKINTPQGLVEINYDRNYNVTAKIGNQTLSADDLKAYGIELTKNGSAVSIKYTKAGEEDRIFNFDKSSAVTNRTLAGSTGLLTQTDELTDRNASADNKNQVMVNSPGIAMAAPVQIVEGTDANYVNNLANGFIDSVKTFGMGSVSSAMSGASSNINNTADVDYNYNPEVDNVKSVQEKAELCARIAYKAIQDNNMDPSLKTQVVANWIKYSSKAMLADIQAGQSTDAATVGQNDSYASRFKTGHGYSNSQWNEYMGTVAFAKSSDINKDGKIDKAIDVNNDGVTDGFDINNDGQLSSWERVLKELDDFAAKQVYVDDLYTQEGLFTFA